MHVSKNKSIPGSVVVSNLIVSTRIGCEAAERQTPQNIRISLEAFFDAKKGCQTDAIDNTINYMSLANMAHELSGEKERNLLETLAYDIAHHAFASFKQLDELRVTTQKFSTVADCDFVGFDCTFKRDMFE